MFDFNLILFAAVFAVALIYSSVGHGGATGYLALISLLGSFVGVETHSPATKASVLLINVCVAGIAWWRFYRAGLFDGKILALFAIASMPCALLGSQIHLAAQAYKITLGTILLASGMVLLFRARSQTDDLKIKKCYWFVAISVGAILGFLAGLTGIGGGVFLSPLLYLFRWVKPKTTGGIAAGFIVLNSLASLVGLGWEKITSVQPLLWLIIPAATGALLGTYWGARRWNNVVFSRVLASVLVFAGGKLLCERMH